MSVATLEYLGGKCLLQHWNILEANVCFNIGVPCCCMILSYSRMSSLKAFPLKE